MGENGTKRMALIASKGTLDWAYPPFILASTAVAMEMEVAVFFTFYGLTLLKKKIKASVSPAGNPAMPMKMPFGPEGFQNLSWPIPNIVSGNVPGFETVATSLMKKTFKNKGVATVEELRDICLESGVKLIGCQMTMDVFGFKKDDFIDGVDIGGAATFLEFAADADIQLFV
ncbi:MAG: DsrE/DsrF/DrsH-like family protein [Candidatus Poseidoniia archaeon]|jgi:peroxiredoxin family protein|nr:peroxiredoxin family protein [Euryarchaeota archaeon]MDP6236194.1 DsrE/DsrF/DrsH-like family protein [Candidatus Poseidoniia archaeon]MBV06847.1 peroxiredoxin family protein [Euryarchaeota archaeon]MDP7255531.1 DsrE/DsrF/DrsH-like family protein [Candidatus Poseidoniia archaeon]MDP7473548.1 DsrE/DsrF/DrsH-like family protein [Candidatus Poseidoniia archaeon]|tara:strand:- start:659 stop:1174 length:516 start_codon:yes stop_codon:yes gene_type:complete